MYSIPILWFDKKFKSIENTNNQYHFESIENTNSIEYSYPAGEGELSAYGYISHYYSK